MGAEAARADDPRDWYVARLKPGGLVRARENLARQDFPSFMPMRSVTRRRGTRLRSVPAALFPGYLFVRVPHGRENWRALNATYGIAHLVALEGRQPTRVPEPLMAALMAACDGESWRAAGAIAEGAEVRVVSTAFADAVARVETLTGRERAIVLLDLMGRTVRTDLPLCDLDPA